MYILEKEISENLSTYFKCKDKTGHTFIDLKEEAMKFSNIDNAIDYNYKHLYGDCIAIRFENKDYSFNVGDRVVVDGVYKAKIMDVGNTRCNVKYIHNFQHEFVDVTRISF